MRGAYEAMVSLDSKIKDDGVILFVPGRDRFAPPDTELRLSVPLTYFFGHDVIWLPLKKNLAEMAQVITHYLRPYQRPVYLLYVGGRPLPSKLLPQGARYLTSQLHEFTEPERANGIPKDMWHLRMGIHVYKL